MHKRLLLIGSSLNYGSPGHICENLGLKAIENGWQVYQAHGVKYSRESKLITHAVCSRLGELRHAFNSLLFDSHGLSSKNETKKLVEWIADISPDVIHLHNLHGYYINYEILFEFLAKYNRPIVWTLHDFWPITGHCAHFDFIGCNKWETGCYECSQINSYPKSLFLDRSERNFHLKKNAFTSVENMTIVPVSNWVGRLVKKSFLNKYKIVPIYNGVDTSIFHYVQSDLRERLNIENKYILLGVASPWYPMKGLFDYYKLQEHLPSDCQIILIGLNRNQISKMPKGIIGLERTSSQKELAEFYSMADVTLNLSYQETFGMTTVEGMACGTPGIVYNRTASPELVNNGTGIVVESGNIDAIISAICAIRSRDKASYAAECVKRVNDSFEKNKQFSKYIELYNKLFDGTSF